MSNEKENPNSLFFSFKKGEPFPQLTALPNLEVLDLREVPAGFQFPKELFELKKLHTLSLTGVKDKLQIPNDLEKLNVTRLEIWDAQAADLPTMPQVKSLYFIPENIEIDIPFLAKKFPNLTQLELHGRERKAKYKIPDDIAAFKHLENLELLAIGAAELPPVLKGMNLKKLKLMSLPFSQFPEVICEMKSLTSLEISYIDFAKLPDSLSQLTQLKTLMMNQCLNKGTRIYGDSEIATMKNLPAVIGQLPQLEELYLSYCGVKDSSYLEPIFSNLKELRILDISAGGVKDLHFLKNCKKLKVLGISNYKTLKNLNGIENLSALEELQLESSEIKDISLIDQLPNLKKINLEYFKTANMAPLGRPGLVLDNMDDEQRESIAKDQALRGLPTFDVLIPQLLSATDGTINDVLEKTLALSEAVGGKKSSALVAELKAFKAGAPKPAAKIEASDDEDYDDEEDSDEDESEDSEYEPVDTALLDAVIKPRLKTLPPILLGKLFYEIFRSIFSDTPLATEIAQELVERKNQEAQEWVVKGFFRSMESYDAGHRDYEGKTQDQLIDDIMINYTPEAIALILETASGDLISSDGLSPYFVAGLKNANKDTFQRISTVLEKHLTKYIGYSTQKDYVDKLMTELKESSVPAIKDLAQTIEKNLKSLIDKKQAKEKLRQTLRDKSADIQKILKEFKNASPDSQKDVQHEFNALLNRPNLSEEALREFMKVVQNVPFLKERTNRFIEDALAEQDFNVCLSVFMSIGMTESQIAQMIRKLSYQWASRKQKKNFELEDDSFEEKKITLSTPTVVEFSAEENAKLNWAEKIDGISPQLQRSNEIHSLLFKAASFDEDAVESAVARLWHHKAYAPEISERSGNLETKLDWSEIASTIGQMSHSKERWPTFLRLVRHIGKLSIPTHSFERILAQILGVCSQSNDMEGCKLALAMAPDIPTWDILAFNMACVSARLEDTAKALKYIHVALDLGKAVSEFRSDKDFEKLQKMPEFEKLLKKYDPVA